MSCSVITTLAQVNQEFMQLQKKANAGNAKAQCELADCYWYGEKGVAINYEQAAIWYSKSAKQNYAPALVAYGMCYIMGVTALIAKHLIISPKMGFFYCAKPLKMGELWCVLVGLGAKISKFSANF